MLCHADARSTLREQLDLAIASILKQSIELAFLGKSQYLRIESSVHGAEDDNQHYCRTVLIDVTERIQVETELREKEQHLMAVANALPVLISYLDREFRFRFCNSAYNLWFGKPDVDLAGRRIQDVLENQGGEIYSFGGKPPAPLAKLATT